MCFGNVVLCLGWWFSWFIFLVGVAGEPMAPNSGVDSVGQLHNAQTEQ